ncbi:MAG: hypothetical protein L3K08_07425 [Thermoplasmata archaeon]|nr:hypothetical protein [Thermoplasmata archaeon]
MRGQEVKVPAPPPGIDAVHVGAIFGALSGLLSLEIPFFDGLVAALAALVAVDWASRLARGGPKRGARKICALSIVVGWSIFLLLPAPEAGFRGLSLGLSLAPLWWTGRRNLPFGSGVRA